MFESCPGRSGEGVFWAPVQTVSKYVSSLLRLDYPRSTERDVMLAATAYQIPFGLIAGPAYVIALLLILITTFRFRFRGQCIGVFIGFLIIWSGRVLATRFGYGDGLWESILKPPPEPSGDLPLEVFFMLFVGWFGSAIVALVWWAVLSLIKSVVCRTRGAKGMQTEAT